MSEDAKKIVRRFFDDVLNEKNVDALHELIDENFQGKVTGDPEPRRGHGGVMKGLGFYQGIAPNFRVKIDDIVSEGNKVAIRFSGRGKHEGEHEDLRPSGKELQTSGLAICRVAGGKIVEGYMYTDLVAFIDQLGVDDGLAVLGRKKGPKEASPAPS